jgi:hypothetical protein
MSVTLADVNFMWQTVIMPRQGDIYVFGGSLSPTAVQQGTDCSGAVSEANEAILHGPGMNWTRQFYTGTFSGAQPGDHGPFGGVQDTADWVCIADPRNPPPGAVMTVAVLQLSDPTQAHMVCAVLDPNNVTGFGGPGVYVGIESGGQFEDPNGNSTLHIGPIATGVDDPEFNQYFALNLPIVDGPPVPPPVLTPLQQNSLTVIAAGQAVGLTVLGQQMELCCGLDESGMRMLANSKVPESLALPHDGVGSDGMSCGPFQQQSNEGWGTVAQEMDWTASATMFSNALAKLPYNSGALPPWQYIQNVQRSATADGSNYEAQWNAAIALYNSVIHLAPGGFLMALTDVQQTQIYDALCGENASESAFATPGEGAIWTAPQLVSNVDSFTHPMYVEWAAKYGQPWALATLATIAATDLTANPSEVENVALAKAVLANLGNPTPKPTPTPTPTPTPKPTPGAVTISMADILRWGKEALVILGYIGTWATAVHGSMVGLSGTSSTVVPLGLAIVSTGLAGHTVHEKHVAEKQLTMEGK